MIPIENSFDITSTERRKILSLALSRGGDFAEIYAEYRLFNFINMEEDIIKETAESVSLGLGIRVISGEKTGYAYTNDLSFENIKKTALTAAAIAHNAGTATIPRFRRTKACGDVYPVRRPARQASLEDKITLVRRAYESCQEFSPRIRKVKVLFQDHVQYVSIAHSEGRTAEDARPQIKLVCTAVAEKDGRREFGFSGGGGRVGMEYFEGVMTPEQIGREAADEAVRLLEAVDSPAGEFPVVLAPGHAGVLVHEAVGHLLEADFNRKRTSIFWDKLGRKIGSPLLTIYDDPTRPSFRGSYAVDDEGTRPTRTLLIDRGVVHSFLQDRLSARIMGRELTGHGRRQDYTCIPLPRMSNTYVDRGRDDPEEILKSVGKGIYAERFEGGQVEDSGKFTFSISAGHLIEGGRLTAPLKQATLIGTNIDILQKIEMVGCDLEFGLQTGTCSKEGQDVPVTDGCPTIKISSMTVGGRR
ncbi:MAG: TldD/PmbA family protein [Candidatus Aminicenantes bacterium]|nr:TldD/PmbA family protein [Candidatus Aminicenantes bacterium]